MFGNSLIENLHTAVPKFIKSSMLIFLVSI
jgi:hypothetical protein